MFGILDFHLRKQLDSYSLEVFSRDSNQLLGAANIKPPEPFSRFGGKQLDLDVKDPAGRVERLRKFGQILYKQIFGYEIQRIWLEHKKANTFLVLCIRIAPEAVELESLAWETLHDGDEFIAAGVKTTVSRLPLDVKPLSTLPIIPAPLRLLALFSSPLDLPEHSRLQLEREQEILLEAINDPAGQGKLRVDFEDEAKLEILESSLETPYQILHFSGHGRSAEDGGGLLLEDVRGNSRPTSVPEVMESLQRGEQSLRLVVLSGCQTARTLEIGGLREMARGLLRREIPSVVAMQFSISDVGGLKFAEVFYARIANGHPVEMAIHAARRSLMLSDDSLLKADALALVLLSGSRDCQKTTQAAPTPDVEAPELGLGFFLPLAQLSHGFYGRRSEYRQVRDAILKDNQRAVIIHGIGGIGKTALVSHVATRLRPRFKGIYTFDCSSGTLAPETVMLELHRYFSEFHSVNALEKILFSKLEPKVLATFLGQLLSQWSLLLIFDNFESQLERVGDGFYIKDPALQTFIKTLVNTTATRSHFLFTSRYWFDLDDRRLGAIESLPLHDLSRPEALSLMQKLPRLGKASYGEKLEALQTFGGHPYALVTLDRHCQHRSLDQALTDAKEIHGELRQFLAIEINYAQLSDNARRLLNGLAAFRQSVPYDAAEWVLGEKVELAPEFLKELKGKNAEFADLDDVTLAAMVEKALPQRRHALDVNRPIRELVEWGLLTPVYENGEVAQLSVHALVREFCRDRDTIDDWRERVRDAAAYYTNSTKLLKREERSPAAVWSEMEAFELLMEIEAFQEAADLLVGATELLDRWGFVHYLDSQHRRLLDVLDSHPTAAVLHNFGYLLQSRGNYEQALAYYQRSLKLKEELGDRAGVASSLHQIGIVQEQRGDYEQALEYYQRSLNISEELGNRAGVASSLHQVGVILQERGDYEQALEYYQRSLEILEEVGNRAGVARSLHNIGSIEQERGDYEQALAYYQRSLDLKEELGDRAGVASSLHQIGSIQQLRGDYEQALAYYQRSLKIAEELGDRAGLAISLHQIGSLQRQRGDYDQALEYYGHSLKLSEELGNRSALAISLHQIGTICQSRGDYDIALQYYDRSLNISEELGNRSGLASSLGQRGVLLVEMGRYDEAFENLLSAVAIFLELQSPSAKIALNALKTLRTRWGEENFKRAWQQSTGTGIPDWFTEPSSATSENQVASVEELKSHALELLKAGIRLVEEGRWQAGLEKLEESRSVIAEANDRDVYADVLYNLGRTHHVAGNMETARLHYRDALRLYQHQNNLTGVANCKLGLGRLMIQMGFVEEAKVQLAEATNIYRDLGQNKRVAEVGEIERVIDSISRRLENEKSRSHME